MLISIQYNRNHIVIDAFGIRDCFRRFLSYTVILLGQYTVQKVHLHVLKVVNNGNKLNILMELDLFI